MKLNDTSSNNRNVLSSIEYVVHTMYHITLWDRVSKRYHIISTLNRIEFYCVNRLLYEFCT